MRPLLVATTAALLAAPLLAPVSASAATEAPAPGIVVRSISGTGCRAGTATAALSPDNTAVTVTYSDYVVAAAGSTRTVSRSCQILLRINPVPGYAPTITSVDYRGFADLGPGSVAWMAATYRFHGVLRAISATRLAGPYSDSWQTTDTGVTGTCSGLHDLDLDTALFLTSRAAGAPTDQITMDSTDAVVPGTVVPSTFHLTWKRCR